MDYANLNSKKKRVKATRADKRKKFSKTLKIKTSINKNSKTEESDKKRRQIRDQT